MEEPIEQNARIVEVLSIPSDDCPKYQILLDQEVKASVYNAETKTWELGKSTHIFAFPKELRGVAPKLLTSVVLKHPSKLVAWLLNARVSVASLEVKEGSVYNGNIAKRDSVWHSIISIIREDKDIDSETKEARQRQLSDYA